MYNLFRAIEELLISFDTCETDGFGWRHLGCSVEVHSGEGRGKEAFHQRIRGHLKTVDE